MGAAEVREVVVGPPNWVRNETRLEEVGVWKEVVRMLMLLNMLLEEQIASELISTVEHMDPHHLRYHSFLVALSVGRHRSEEVQTNN